MDREAIINSFKNYDPDKNKQSNTEQNISPEEEDDEEEILEQDYRYTCMQAYKATADPLWLFKTLMESEEGGIVFIPEFQEEIIKFYEKHKKEFNINIEACVDHGKTHLITCLNAHEKIKDFRHTTIYSSENATTAKARVNKIYNYLKMYSNISEEVIEFETEQSSSFNIKGNTKVDNSCHARNFLSQYTGAHVNLFVMDDVETLDTISLIDQIIDAYQTKASRRKSATGKMIAINTPYSSNGFLTFLREEQEWITLQIALPEKLLDEEKLQVIIEEFEKTDVDEIIKDKILNFLYKKWIFQAIDILKVSSIEEELKNSFIENLKDTLDFRYRKRIILHGEVISEEILPAWDWKVKRSGKDILSLYLTANKSYQLTYALNTESGEGGGFFTYHTDAKINQQELSLLLEEQHWKVFAYDMSSDKRAGTVIIEAIITKELLIIISMRKTNQSIYAVEENIKIYRDCIHIIERNSWQETIINYMTTKEIDKDINDNIIFHYTGKNKYELQNGIISMNNAFYQQKTVFLENGEGLKDLAIKLSSYNNKKTKSEQWDEIDTLWFLHHNAEAVRNRKMKPTIIIPRKERFTHINKIY